MEDYKNSFRRFCSNLYEMQKGEYEHSNIGDNEFTKMSIMRLNVECTINRMKGAYIYIVSFIITEPNETKEFIDIYFEYANKVLNILPEKDRHYLYV